MKKRILLLLTVVSVAGCVDTPDSVCREYRNANNEHIDALMMVTSERQAKKMTIRVFQNMLNRYRDLDKKWDIMETNWGNKGPDAQAVKDFLESNGLHLYRAEYRANAQRCTLELARIRNLLDQNVERAKQTAKEDGINPENVNANELFPALFALVNTKSILDPLRNQLEKPKLEEQILNRFNGRIDTQKDEGKAVLKIYNEKYKLFTEVNENRPDIVLAR